MSHTKICSEGEAASSSAMLTPPSTGDDSTTSMIADDLTEQSPAEFTPDQTDRHPRRECAPSLARCRIGRRRPAGQRDPTYSRRNVRWRLGRPAGTSSRSGRAAPMGVSISTAVRARIARFRARPRIPRVSSVTGVMRRQPPVGCGCYGALARAELLGSRPPLRRVTARSIISCSGLPAVVGGRRHPSDPGGRRIRVNGTDGYVELLATT